MRSEYLWKAYTPTKLEASQEFLQMIKLTLMTQPRKQTVVFHYSKIG